MTPTALPDLTLTTLAGDAVPLRDWAGQVLLVVNTASACGFTPQFAGLQQLHQRYADQGLVVLGFPCNQFGQQDKGSNSEIAGFCQRNYGVDFPMMAKVDVNGPQAHPLFQWLRAEKGGLLTNAIKWNFTKFLLDRDGNVIGRFAPTTKPESLSGNIEKALGVPSTGAPEAPTEDVTEA